MLKVTDAETRKKGTAEVARKGPVDDSRALMTNFRRLDSTPANSAGHSVAAPVDIEDRVWIGTRCIILKDVSLGHKNSVIAAGQSNDD